MPNAIRLIALTIIAPLKTKLTLLVFCLLLCASAWAQGSQDGESRDAQKPMAAQILESPSDELLPIALTSAKAAPPIVSEATRQELAVSYGKLPLSFEANQGQSDRLVKFLARGSGYTLFLTSDEAVLALKSASPESTKAKGSADSRPALSRSTPSERTCVRLKLVGASPAARESGVGELTGKANYFIGNDPKKWSTNVPAYAKVKYEAVYPGVDLIYYGNQHQLEYDFVVAAGADPKAIRLSFRGARKLGLDEQGNLVLEARHGQVRLEQPQTPLPPRSTPVVLPWCTRPTWAEVISILAKALPSIARAIRM